MPEGEHVAGRLGKSPQTKQRAMGRWRAERVNWAQSVAVGQKVSREEVKEGHEVKSVTDSFMLGILLASRFWHAGLSAQDPAALAR